MLVCLSSTRLAATRPPPFTGHDSYLFNKLFSLLDADGAVKAELQDPGQTRLRRARQILIRESVLENIVKSLAMHDKIAQGIKPLLASQAFTCIPSTPHELVGNTVSPELVEDNRSLVKLRTVVRDQVCRESSMVTDLRVKVTEAASSHFSTSDSSAISSPLELLSLHRDLVGLVEEILQSADRLLESLASQSQTGAGHGRALTHFGEYLEGVCIALYAKSKMNATLLEMAIYRAESIHVLRRIGQEVSLIRTNLEAREKSIHNSIARYRAGGQGFQQCEKEIDRLLYLRPTT